MLVAVSLQYQLSLNCMVSGCARVCDLRVLCARCSGYDFGYLLRVLTSLKLPDKEQQFFELLSVYFPKVYDVKYLMKSCKNLKGGLQEVADHLEVHRQTDRQTDRQDRCHLSLWAFE